MRRAVKKVLNSTFFSFCTSESKKKIIITSLEVHSEENLRLLKWIKRPITGGDLIRRRKTGSIDWMQSKQKHFVQTGKNFFSDDKQCKKEEMLQKAFVCSTKLCFCYYATSLPESLAMCLLLGNLWEEVKRCIKSEFFHIRVAASALEAVGKAETARVQLIRQSRW